MNNDTQVSASVKNYKMTSGNWGTKPGQIPSGGGTAKVEVRTLRNILNISYSYNLYYYAKINIFYAFYFITKYNYI